MKGIVAIALLILSPIVFGQGIQDSVFTIQQVQISSDFTFQKEKAGMKETRLDSSVLAGNVHLNLSDLLAENTTLYFKDYGRGALSTISFRGTAPSHTQVSWNGLNINSPMLGMVDFTLIPVFVLDQVKVQYGTGSLSSRSGGLGGHIELRNQADWTNKTGGKIYQDYGSFGTANVFAQVNAGNNKIQSKSRIYRIQSKNNYTFPNKNIIETDSLTGERYHPVQENKNADYQTSGFMQEFYFRPLSKLLVSNSTWGQSAERSLPTVLSNEYTEESLQRQNKQTDNTLKNVTEISYYTKNSKILFRSGIDYQNIGYLMIYNFPMQASSTISNASSKMISWSNLIGYSRDISDKLSAQFKATYNCYNIASFDKVSQFGYKAKRKETSLFGGLFYIPVEKIQLSLQLRKDFISDSESPIIYSTGVNIKPFIDHDFIIKANFGRNFHTPSLNDLYWQPGGNPNLKPEKGYTAEITGNYSKAVSSLTISIASSAYFSKIQDWMMWLPAFKGYWEPFNIKEVRSYGFENMLAISYAFRKTEFKLNGNFAVTHTKNYGDPLIPGDESVEKQLPFIPVLSGNFSTSVVNRGFYVIYHNSSTGIRYLMSSNIEASDDPSNQLTYASGADYLYTLYPHFLNKLTLGKFINLPFGKLSVELYVNNLFNETYRNILQRFMPGRSYNIHIKFDF